MHDKLTDMSLQQIMPGANNVLTDYQNYFSLFRKCLLDIRAINNGIRHDIINLIYNAKEMCVTDMFVKLRLEQSVVSQHLAALKNLGVVRSRRDGKNIFYSLDLKTIEILLQFINDITSTNDASIKENKIDFGEVNFAYEILRVLSHELRLKIIDTIIHHENYINVNNIYTALNIEQSITSQHLKLMRDVKLCETHKSGKHIFYSMHTAKLDFIIDKISKLYNK